MTLENHLWAAADILRGSIDGGDYKTYIFGLLFLKRLSDRFDEGCRDFHVPDRARWDVIRNTAANVGERLNAACAALEDENPGLEGVLIGVDYADEHRLGDRRQRDDVLARLVRHFSRISLRNDRLAEPDLLGRAYERLIERFADDAGRRAGEFYTPRMVVKLIVELLDVEEGMSVCDPAAGSGGMLIECARHARGLVLHGQEKNRAAWAVCKMNMLLHGLPGARVEKGDTIREPRLVEDGRLLLYDRVIANPPFSLSGWGRDEAEDDRHGRFRFGLPPRNRGDLAFVQHMVAALNAKGRLGVVLPHGPLFRGGSEADIRRGMLREDLIEAVIGIAPRLFHGTGIPTAVVVVDRGKPAPRTRKVLFVDASGAFEKGRNRNRLREEDVRRVVSTFRAGEDVDGFARAVSLEEIERNGWKLNVNHYVDPARDDAPLDLADAVRALRETRRECDAAWKALDDNLAEMGFDA